jgi:hypothetical protein
MSDEYINTRSTLLSPYDHDDHHHTAKWNIILSCFFTIFICAWVSIRPNIPTMAKPPGPKRFHNLYTSWTLLYERLVLVFIFVIFPEVILAFALVQRQMAGAMKKYAGT